VNIRGNVDRYIPGVSLAGWVIDETNPAYAGIKISVACKGEILGETVARLVRGDGYHGFDVSILPVISEQLLAGEIEVLAKNASGEIRPLPIYKKLLAELSGGAQAASAGEELPKPVSLQELSPLLVSLNVKSQDKSAILGSDGYIFLFKGSNEVASLYAESKTASHVRERTSRWIGLFERRYRRLSDLRVAYTQLIIPEKSSVLLEQAPASLRPITPTFEFIEDHFAQRAAAGGTYAHYPFYISCLNVLRGQAQLALRPFAKTDSHFSAAGALCVFGRFLDQLSILLPASATEIQNAQQALAALYTPSPSQRVFNGDLSDRFFGTTIYEIIDELDLTSLLPIQLNISTTILKEAPANAHTGHHQVWFNPDAPIKLRVIAFANSFFERGGAPRGLSWWFITFFTEFHFVWSADIDMEMIEKKQPDLVICQSIERFLPVLPKD